MNQKFLSGFTATLLIATLGGVPGYADQSGTSADTLNSGLVEEVSAPASSLDQEASTQAIEQGSSQASPEGDASPAAPAQPASPSASQVSSPESPANSQAQPQEPVKVGEYQEQDQASPDQPIAVIHSHELEGRQAATLYIRDIPVLTFLEPDAQPAGEANSAPSTAPKTADSLEEGRLNRSSPTDTKVASTQSPPENEAAAPAQPMNDPIWRATEIAARINQLQQDSVDANDITAIWDEQQQSYLIKAGDRLIVQMTTDTILPNTTQDPAEDALQAANLIRRQVGNAPPLDDVVGRPAAPTQVALGPVRLSISGWASWYGPGFDGNYSASGEVFDQNAMTAAHPDLPFGTQVRVTNMDNGESVVVRINDRGPYAGGRIIDLSHGAASVIGLVHSGVAPVTVEVLDSSAAAP